MSLRRKKKEPRSRRKNALLKQYKQLMNMEGVDLTFTDDAVQAIAKTALQKKTGARGLRSILERCMLEIMFDVPSEPGLKEIIITPDVVLNRKQPVRVLHKEALAG